MTLLSKTLNENLEHYLNKEVHVVFNEDDYLTLYRGVLKSYNDQGIQLLVSGKYIDKLPFFDGHVKKIFHIYNTETFDLFLDRHEKTLGALMLDDYKIAHINAILRKNFNNKLVAIRSVNGQAQLIKGPLVEITHNSIRIQTSYYEKTDILFINLLHLYDGNLKEIIIFEK